MSHNNGFDTAEPESKKMVDSRFEMLDKEETAELLNGKENEDTQKAYKLGSKFLPIIYFQFS